MIYVPDTAYACYVLSDKDTIRAYKTMPYNPSYNGGNVDINYRDYYINSDYLYTDGFQSFSYYSALPVCLDKSNLTTDVYYRHDIDKILVIFTILVIFGISLPLKIFSKLFKRGGL